jgi:heat shock protein 5
VQRDKKLVSYDIVDKQGKPYVKVQVGKEDKVSLAFHCFD